MLPARPITGAHQLVTLPTPPPTPPSAPSPTRSIRLERLQAPFGKLTPTRGAQYAEAAKVALSPPHKSPVELEIVEKELEIVHLSWSQAHPNANQAWADSTEATEDGACAVALLVVEHRYRYVFRSRALKHTGCDFLVAPPGEETDMFQPPAVRLEVSGIGAGTQQDEDRRMDIKLEQVQRGGAAPFIVVVVNFSGPKSLVKSHGIA